MDLPYHTLNQNYWNNDSRIIIPWWKGQTVEADNRETKEKGEDEGGRRFLFRAKETGSFYRTLSFTFFFLRKPRISTKPWNSFPPEGKCCPSPPSFSFSLFHLLLLSIRLSLVHISLYRYNALREIVYENICVCILFSSFTLTAIMKTEKRWLHMVVDI